MKLLLLVVYTFCLETMVISCSSWNCQTRMKKGSGISFHRFPVKHPALLHKWVRAVKQDGFVPNKNSFLCSKHFTENCFWVTGKRHRLKNDAVPTVFTFSKCKVLLLAIRWSFVVLCFVCLVLLLKLCQRFLLLWLCIKCLATFGECCESVP